MYRSLLATVFFAATAALAQDKKWEPPTVPDGWKSVTSKDGVYMFVAPKDTRRSGSRDRTFSSGGVRVRGQVDYYVLKDGTELSVQSALLTGAALKGVKANDLTDVILAAERDDGFSISEPKEVAVGTLTAREYRMTKGGQSRRVVIFSARPRIFVMDVTAAGLDQLDTKAADTFLKSFVMVPPEVVKAAAKERAEKALEASKAGEEKVGVKWTLNFKEMTPPDAPVVGLIRGKEFRPDKVELRGGQLVFRSGKEFFADVEVALALFQKAGESLENKTIAIPPANFNPPASPHVRLSTMPANGKLPQTESHLSKYALKLTFGAKETDGTLPGTIYLCTPDAARSVLAGTFTVKEK